MMIEPLIDRLKALPAGDRANMLSMVQFMDVKRIWELLHQVPEDKPEVRRFMKDVYTMRRLIVAMEEGK